MLLQCTVEADNNVKVVSHGLAPLTADLAECEALQCIWTCFIQLLQTFMMV